MSDLLPCPFCPPEQSLPQLTRPTSSVVRCGGCGTETLESTWNRRALPSADAFGELLRAYLDDLDDPKVSLTFTVAALLRDAHYLTYVGRPRELGQRPEPSDKLKRILVSARREGGT